MGVSSTTEEQKGKPKPNGLTKLCNNHDQVASEADDHEESNKRECQGIKRHVVFRKRNCSRRRPKRVIVMKRRRVGGGASRRRHGNVNNGIVRRVRTLKSLIPNGDSQGLDGLFRDTADYILSLQMRVRVMQIMVNVLSSAPEE